MNINATILGQAISFFFFVIICMKYIWPQIMSIIEKRQKEISENFSSIENTKKDIEAAKIQATIELNKIKQDAKKIIDLANERKLKIIDEANIIANQEYQNLIKQAQVRIDLEYKKASEELRKQAVILAMEAANKIIKHSIDKNIDRDIINQLITTL